MKDVSKLIANLSPEKRAELLQRLKSNSGKAEIGKTKNKDKTAYVPKDGDNYYCHVEKPGNFSSIVLKQIEMVPPPKPNQIQIKAKAASLNFRDILIGLNMYYDPPGVTTTMGTDYSGIVTEVGANIKNFKKGDHVLFFSTENFKAYQNAEDFNVIKKPDNISWEEAAAIPTAYMTSYYSLRYVANLKPGKRVLIHTATGGVGLSAIEIAKWLGAEIFVTAGTDKKIEYLKSMGFKAPMNSRTLDFADEIMDRTNGEGIDVVLNTIAGEATVKGLEILRQYGHFLQIDLKDIAANKSIPLAAFTRNLSFTALNMGWHPERSTEYMNEVSELHAKGIFKPLVVNNFKIDELGRALAFLSKSEHIGKVVLQYL
ncbi:MAG: zinc-binding dehydrogenase [Bacteroidota bacterium]